MSCESGCGVSSGSGRVSVEFVWAGGSVPRVWCQDFRACSELPVDDARLAVLEVVAEYVDRWATPPREIRVRLGDGERVVLTFRSFPSPGYSSGCLVRLGRPSSGVKLHPLSSS